MGQSALASAILHELEEYPLFSLDLPTLLSCSTCSNPEEAVLRCFSESRRSSPSVIFWPHIDLWWSTAPTTLANTLLLLLNDMPALTPVLLMATADCVFEELPDVCQRIFGGVAGLNCAAPKTKAKSKFFKPLFMDMSLPPHILATQVTSPSFPPLPKAPKTEDSNKSETTQVELQEEQSLLLNLRLFLRGLCNSLFTQFKELQDTLVNEVKPKVIQHMSLTDIRSKINDHKYLTVKEFLNDIDLIVSNVKEWADGGTMHSQTILNKACHLQDVALSLVGQLDTRLAKKCEIVAQKIRARQIQRTESVGQKSISPTMSKENSLGLDKVETIQRASTRIRGIPADVLFSSPTLQLPTRKVSRSSLQASLNGSQVSLQSLPRLSLSTLESAIPTSSVDCPLFSSSPASPTSLPSATTLSTSPQSPSLSLTSTVSFIASTSSHSSLISSSSSTIPVLVAFSAASSSCTSPVPLTSAAPSVFVGDVQPSAGSSSSAFSTCASESPPLTGASFDAINPELTALSPSNNAGSCENSQLIEKKVTLDSGDLNDFKALLREKTIDSSVDELEVIFFKLYRCIYQHEMEWDKSNLLAHLRQELTGW